MLAHLSIRVWPRDSTTSVFSRGPTGPERVGSGCPVRMIRIIARTARYAMTDATIRKRTLIVPRTICNGPVMLFLPRTPGGVGSSHPPHGEGLIVAARRRPHRPGPVRGSHAGAGARTVRTIAGTRSGYSSVTRCRSAPQDVPGPTCQVDTPDVALAHYCATC